MTVHLPPLFTILGVAFASIVVGWIVFSILGFVGFMGAWGGSWPEWPGKIAIPCGIIAAIGSSFYFATLT